MPRKLSLFNASSKSVEIFKPIETDQVGIYCCGPTVYNYAHIGNMRTYIFEDILRRTAENAGYQVNHVMNITDVGHLQSDADQGDDKMSLASQRERKSPWDIAQYYTEAFFRHAQALGIKKPNIVCKATDHIQEMIAMVEVLIDKGHAYAVNGNVYFDVSTFADYTKFANLQLEAQQATERVEIDDNKRNQADFCLWFSQSKYPHQIMKWQSPWGVGFPGWHIECSAMSAKYLGTRFDIHCGGIDHIPVHHTNEIAQSDCCHGHKTVNYWMHGAFLTVDIGKMSKSSGDFLTVDTLITDGYSPMAYRYLVLTAHYRSELKFSYAALQNAQNTLYGLIEKVQEWRSSGAASTADELDVPAVTGYLAAFWQAMGEDLHTPSALTELWKVVKDPSLSNGQKLYLIQQFDQVLGLSLEGACRGELSVDEQALLDARQVARETKNWAESDRLRDELLALGITVKDSPQGMRWTRVTRN